MSKELNDVIMVLESKYNYDVRELVKVQTKLEKLDRVIDIVDKDSKTSIAKQLAYEIIVGIIKGE